MTAPALRSDARTSILDRLEAETFDLAVIGGGITGAGLAREAALRGLSVALLEAEDFASGTSSRSSKLIHGGLRYLAMGDVALVRSTALERKQIHRLAPHLAEPRWMVVPTRSRTGLLKLRAGITTYEKLGAVEAKDLHRNWGEEELASEEPAIDRATYRHACAYREYLTDDARLVLANLRAAARRGAAALNHARVDRIVQEQGIATGVEAVCNETGRRFRVRSRVVVNAAGPWVETIRHLEDPEAPPLLHLSKGVHIVVPAERLPVRNVILMNTADRRSIFAIRRGPVVYLGTTDTTYGRGAEVWPVIERQEVEYLLEPVGRYFSVAPIQPEEVIGAWSGLRPLVAKPGKKPHEISRKEEVVIGPARVVTIAGGKLTGYRPMARETLERAAEVGGLQLSPRPEEAPLPGGDFEGDLDGMASALVRETGISESHAARVVRLYGGEASQVVALGAEPVAGSTVLEGEVDWAVGFESATTLEDLLYRRTRAAFYDPIARGEALEPLADRLARLLGWNAERRDAELGRVRDRVAADLQFL